MSNVILKVRNVSKTYGPIRALVDVDFQLERGEVRALLGKNGAGKSTLVNLISGSEQPDSDSGGIFVNDVKEVWSTPMAARLAGIAVVRQEFSLVSGLSVAENISLGMWPKKNSKGIGVIDREKMNSIAAKTLSLIDQDIPLSAEVGDLSLAQRQLIEIAKALAINPKILILDEPTSALNLNEVNNLLDLVRRLSASGISVIYVSHRMQEIPRVADTLSVLRDGKIIETNLVSNFSIDQVARLVAGESNLERTQIEKTYNSTNEVVLSVRNLKNERTLRGISFELHDREVLGIAGLLGSGRTEILEAIFGTSKEKIDGEVVIFNKKQRKRTSRSMLTLGIGLTPEDRRDLGIFPLLGVGENIVISARGRSIKEKYLRKKLENNLIDRFIHRLQIATSSQSQLISSLSGGNQQKAVIGRLLAADMKILLLDEPTRGIDISSKIQIYNLIRDLARDGVSCIFISSEFEELSQVCDRVLVLSNGEIIETISGLEATPERLFASTMRGVL